MINHLRELNGVLALLTVALGLGWRTPGALKKVASKRVYLVLLLFPLGVGAGSVYAAAKHFPPSPFVPYFTGCYLILGAVLTFWWPAALKYDPRQEHEDVQLPR